MLCTSMVWKEPSHMVVALPRTLHLYDGACRNVAASLGDEHVYPAKLTWFISGSRHELFNLGCDTVEKNSEVKDSGVCECEREWAIWSRIAEEKVVWWSWKGVRANHLEMKPLKTRLQLNSKTRVPVWFFWPGRKYGQTVGENLKNKENNPVTVFSELIPQHPKPYLERSFVKVTWPPLHCTSSISWC